MAVPVAYTEQELAQYMARTLGPSNVSTLDWTPEGSITTALEEYQEPVYDALFALGETDISEYDTDAEIHALRATARWKAWEAARDAVADRYDESPGGGISMKRSQLFEMASKNERAAFAAAMNAMAAADLSGPLGMTVEIIPTAVYTDEDGAEFG